MSRSRKFQKRTDEFMVTAENGRKFAIVELTNYVESRSMNRPPQILEGLKEYRTPAGRLCGQQVIRGHL